MTLKDKILKLNFEYRVIISYLIFGIALLTLIFSKNYTYLIIADIFKIDKNITMSVTFLFIGFINLYTWIFRSYAGGYLTGHISVTKEVQTYKLVTNGPYAYVRNPLYLSDIISITVIGFAGPPIAILILFFGKITTSYMYVVYEENSLLKEFREEYKRYSREVPRFIPRITPYKSEDNKGVKINWKDGLMYNFYAFGIGIAFIISAFTLNRNHLYLFGFIAPALWFFLRFFDRHLIKIVNRK